MGNNVMLLVHGGGGNAQEMQPFANAFNPQMQCVGLNLLGHGGRPIPASHSLDEMADDLAENIIRAGLQGNFLFGYCAGALVVLNLLIRHRKIVQAAILLAPRYRYDPNVLAHYFYLQSEERLTRPDCARAKQYEAAQGPRWLEVARNNREMYASFGQRPPIDEALLQQIDCPVMVIGPTNDPTTTHAEAADLARHIPRSTLLTLHGSAHPVTALPIAQIAKQAQLFCQRAG
jgi:pimeloyl-ACP methyl ester carboxylesterase